MRKENIILGGVFVFLLALAFVFEPIMDWKKNLGRPDNFFDKIKFEEVIKINLEKNGEKISFERQGEKWKIADTKDFYVKDTDEIFVTYMEEAIEANFDLASNNKDKKSEFETDESGTRVSLEDSEGVLIDFIVGKMTNDFAGSYVSIPDSNNIYKVGANIGYAFNKDVNSWYDTMIFAGGPELANKIRFQYPNSEFSIEKIDEEWKGTLPYSFSVDEEKINKVLEIMTSLNAAGIPAQTFEGTGLENHSVIVEVSGDGVQNVLMVGGENAEGNFFAKKGSSDNIYLISSEQKETLDTSIRDLR
ncbi:MAG: DUF4340 domain-containing protein [Patescibacteria group bacterium]|jgi:hypothetical protein|nr:DUF4340 domain-containing protein [Patescibacteria group bacterium]